jgi:DNA-directed RNA polymerase subunit RPC12/RpoP
MFAEFQTVFWVIFVLAFVVIIVSWIIRLAKAGNADVEQRTSENQVVVKEKEIIREVVKIRCQYCGNLYDEVLDECPHCGGKRS